VLACRELDAALRMTDLGEDLLNDWRRARARNTRWSRSSGSLVTTMWTTQGRLQLSVLVYNLGNFLRQAALPQAVRHWTLMTLREKLIKIGAKVAPHSRKIVFQMVEVAVPRELFRSILAEIARLRLPAAATE
jgi:hypothetical protein